MLDVLKRLFPPRSKQSATTRLTYDAVRGTDAVWTPRNFTDLVKEGFEQVSWVYACVNLLTKAALSVRWYVVVDGKEVPDHPLIKLLHRPNDMTSGPAFVESVYGFWLLTGNSYIEIVGLPNRPPLELWSKRPDRMKVIPDPVTLVRGYRYEISGQSYDYDRANIVHIKTWAPLNDWYGMSPISAAARGIDLFNTGQAHNLALVQNGARPSGAWISQTPMTDRQLARARQELDAASLLGRRGRPMVLEGGVSWQELGLSPKDLDWLQGQEDAARQIHAVFGVHPVLTGMTEGTYENQKQVMRSVMINSVLPFLDVFSQELVSALSSRYKQNIQLMYDKDAFDALSEDQESLWKRAETGWVNGLLTRNEARTIVGFDAVPEGDTFFGSAGVVPEVRSVRSTEGSAEFRYWKSRVDLQRSWEDRLEPVIRSLFDEERSRISEVLKGVNNSTEVYQRVSEQIRPQDWEDRLFPWWLASMAAGGENALGQLSRSKSVKLVIPDEPSDIFMQIFGIFASRSLDYAVNHVPKVVGQITLVTLAELQNAIFDGIALGLSIPDLAALIDELYLEQIIPNRSTVIARTEIIAATNYGSRQAAKGTGLELTKRWISTFDGRARPTHEAAGLTPAIGIDSLYSVGSARLMFPGDPEGPAEEVIQCRCTEVYQEVS